MVNATIVITAFLAGLFLLIGMSILIYQHYRIRRKSIDWGDIERYDTPLELIPTGSNNSSFRSYKYSQLVAKRDASGSHHWNRQSSMKRPSVGNIDRHRETRGSRTSTKSCPAEVYTYPAQEFRVNQEQQWIQPYYYYRKIVVNPTTKTRHSLPEVVTTNSSLLHPHPHSNIQSTHSYTRHQPCHLDDRIQHTSWRNRGGSIVEENYYEEIGPPGVNPSILRFEQEGNFRSNLRRRSENLQLQLLQQRRRSSFGPPPQEDGLVPDKRLSSVLGSPAASAHQHQSTSVWAEEAKQLHLQQQQLIEENEKRLAELRNYRRLSTHHNPQYLQVGQEGGNGTSQPIMLTHQSRSLPTGPPIPGARLNRTYSISSQGHIETAVRKGHRGSSPAIRTYNPEGFSFDVTSPPDSPPPTYLGSRSPSPLQVRAASLDIHRSGSPCPDFRGSSPLGESNVQHSSHSMDSYPTGKVMMLSPNSLCARRSSRSLSPLFIPPMSPKSPTDGLNSASSSQPSSTGPLSPMIGSLQLDLYQKKDVTVYLDSIGRITPLTNDMVGVKNGKNKGKNGENGSVTNCFKSSGHRSLGRLHFRLKYDLDKSDLQIHVIEAHDLAKGDAGGFNDPYIRLFISPEVDNRKRETNTHRNESNPFFDEHFKFPVSQEDLKEKVLLLQVLDFDRYSRNDVVGEVSLALEEFDITTNLEVWADVAQNKKPSGEKQEILISLSYLPSAERLTVVLLNARNLHPLESKESIDPFVKVYLLGGGRRQKKKKTTARKNSDNPRWNEAFTFDIPATSLSKSAIEPWEKPKRIERAHRQDLHEIFKKHSTEGAFGYSFIRSTDFVQKFLGVLDSKDCNTETLKLLAGIIDTSKDGFISFPEFVAFEGLLCVADALYFIAFRLFDTNGNGLVSFDEFERVIRHTTLYRKIPFNMDGKFVRMYFGRRKDRVVTYAEFSQFLHDFHEEYAREAFRRFDRKRSSSGFIAVEDFIQIMTHIRSHLLTSSVSAKLEEVVRSLSQDNRVSFPFFAAFNSLLNNMELMKKIYLQASRGIPNVEITKDEFLHSGQMISHVTPLQVDILFSLSQCINESPTIILSDLQSIAPEQYYIKVEDRILDIKAVSCRDERGLLIELMESAYRFSLGWIAGVFEAIPTYPMDVVKTRMQLQRPSRLLERRVYQTNIDCLLKINTVEGMKGMYRGLAPHVIASSLGKAFKLSMNDWIRDRFMNRKGQVPFHWGVFAGACAGACSAVVVNPLEIVKIRMQAAGQLFPKAKLSAWKVIKNLGFTGIYKGFSACLLRDVPFSAIFFPCYAYLKIRLQDEDEYNSVPSLLIAGAVSTLPAVPISMPFDLIKTRLQVVPRPGETAYKGLLDCAFRIWKEEGPKTFMQGTRVIKPTQVGLALLVYELLQRFIYVDFAGTRPTGSDQRVQICSLHQLKSENPDHIGGYALALPVLHGIETKFGLVFPKFSHENIVPLV